MYSITVDDHLGGYSKALSGSGYINFHRLDGS
jgi:hypothetical protein